MVTTKRLSSRNHLSSDDKQELLGLIEDYRQGLVLPIVPSTLLKHHLNRYPAPEWMHQQVYLHPYPKGLMLRDRVWALAHLLSPKDPFSGLIERGFASKIGKQGSTL